MTARRKMTMTPKHPEKLICFDWDGTIGHSMPLCIEECRAALLYFGLPDLPDETLRLCNGPTDWDACAILGVPDDMRHDFVRVRSGYGLQLMKEQVTLFPGMAETLRRLAAEARLAVVSNGQQDYIRESISHFGLGDLICDYRAYTPGRTKAQLLQDLLQQLEPASAIMVGDRLGDLDAGKQNSLPTVAACYGYGNDAEYAAADIRCDDVAALESVLMKWVETEQLS